MKREVIFSLVFVFIFSILLVSASFDVGDLDVINFQEVYGKNRSLKGMVNISFENELASSLLSDSFGNSISLIDALDLSENIFECEPEDCEVVYEASGQSNTKDLIVNKDDDEIYVGLKVKGKDVYIDSVSMNVKGNLVESSCDVPISIDFGDDGEVEWIYNVVTNEYGMCNAFNGCFSQTAVLSPAIITDIAYCEEMELIEASNWQIGGKIKRGEEDRSITMYIEGEGVYESCELNINEMSKTSFTSVYCNVDVNTKVENYSICVQSGDALREDQYSIMKEDESPTCGLYGYDRVSVDYQLIARSSKYAGFDSEVIVEGEEVGIAIQDFIDERYNSDCEEGCVIPVRFIVGNNFNLVVSDLNLLYDSDSGASVRQDLYSLDKKSAKIESNFSLVDISRIGFKTGNEEGEHEYIFEFKGEELFRRNISIVNVPVISNLAPLSIPAGVNIDFSADVEIPEEFNVEEYHWEFSKDIGFGVKDEDVTSVLESTYSWEDVGKGYIKISAVSDEGVSVSEVFDVDVFSPIEEFNISLISKREKLENFRDDVSLDEYSVEILEYLDLDQIESELVFLNDSYESLLVDATGSEIVDLFLQLQDLRVPESISYENIPSSDVVVENYEVFPEYIALLSNKEYNSSLESDYKSAIVNWISDIELSKSVKIIDVDYDDGESESVLSVFEVIFNPYEFGSYYVVINENFDELNFKEGTPQRVSSVSGVSFLGAGSEQNIKFIVDGRKTASEVSVFASPDLDLLDLSVEGEEEKSKIGLIIVLVIVLIIFVGILIYFLKTNVFRGKGGRRVSGKSLGKRDLANLRFFVGNLRKKGIKDKEIMGKLKRAGWSSSQIKYILKVTKN